LCASAEVSNDAIATAWAKVESAEKAVETARRAIDDADTAVDRSKTDLERAKKNAVDAASDKLTSAQNSYHDAERAYEKALNDKTRAIDDYVKSNQTKLENAQKAYDDSQKQLESSENSLKSAQNALSQAVNKPETQGASVEMQELNLEKLNNQLAEGKIIATADGVITESYAKVGATPNGILFVIEDTENLYVSVRIKEYNLSAISLGQEAVITTDATGDMVYSGVVSYISPKAVSAAGSTSVEFEVRASLHQPDAGIKIGMNAFVNIITESKSDVYAVPNPMILTNERGSFVYAISDNEKQEIPVAPGMKTAAHTEITGDGLYEGMLLTDPEGLAANDGQARRQPMPGR